MEELKERRKLNSNQLIYTIYELAQPAMLDWKRLFDQNVHSYLKWKESIGLKDSVEDSNKIRIIEEEIDHINEIRYRIYGNVRLVKNSEFLDCLMKYYEEYISWIDTVSKWMHFGKEHKIMLRSKFKWWYKGSKDYISSYDPDFEIYWMKYNLACICYAKGVLIIQEKEFTKKGEEYFAKAAKIFHSLMEIQNKEFKQILDHSELLGLKASARIYYALTGYIRDVDDSAGGLNYCILLYKVFNEIEKLSEIKINRSEVEKWQNRHRILHIWASFLILKNYERMGSNINKQTKKDAKDMIKQFQKLELKRRYLPEK